MSSNHGPIAICCACLAGTVCMTTLLVLGLSVPIASIVIGSLYKDQCPAEPHIPIFLIVLGAFGIIRDLFSCCKVTTTNKDEETPPACNIIHLIDLFLFAWIITGSYWVFRIYAPDYVDSTSAVYCHKTLYLFSFVLLLIGYAVSALSVFCAICVGICTLCLTCVRE